MRTSFAVSFRISRGASPATNCRHCCRTMVFHVARALVGSESTLVFVLEAAMHLVPHFAHSVLILGYPDIFEAADAVPEILEHRPIGLEGIDEKLIRSGGQTALHTNSLRLLPAGRGW